jgi:16S rRNA (guanine966-N2)-methyltransferase
VRGQSNFRKKPSKSQKDGKSSGEIRIIGGQWRGRKLKVHNKEGLRPTTDRLKETIFNWLMMDIRGKQVLDCFAGAGSLGFEAMSRGAEHLVCIEKDKVAAQQLKHNCDVLGVNHSVIVKQGDFFTCIKQFETPFNLVFIDPPFHKGLTENTFQSLVDNQLLEDGALVYLEQEATTPFDINSSELAVSFEIIKDKQAGQVRAQLLQYSK